MSEEKSEHNFHIPVMGTGFTVDTPQKVAKYGISAVISLADDILIERMRKFWCEKSNEPYVAIDIKDQDCRANRITAYLNLVKKIVEKQIKQLKASVFAEKSEITNYFEMLPNTPSKQNYQKMLAEKDPSIKLKMQEQLRNEVVPGSIDVNIMTKLDQPHYASDNTMLPYMFCDAAAALRGYANSDLCSTIIFSAGFNPHLYGYTAAFKDFFPDENGGLKKKICLKVSDYRSAAIQGKYLAKHGLWVSEYRIESPLNCGGHAFINDGQLLGPILEEFKQCKDNLIETLYSFYQTALRNLKKLCLDTPPSVRFTAQGGVGINAEHELLIKYYGLDAVGWGTPFLLVPEATNVDDLHLQKLINARIEDVFLSSSSPLGVPFWNLFNSSSEEARRERIQKGTPGSICCKGYARIDREFTEKPICKASREFQQLKLAELEKLNLPLEQVNARREDILNKSCICQDLAGGAAIKNNLGMKAPSAICPGPNIINFKKVMTLKEIVNHIYGRCSEIVNSDRPNLFISEIQLQLNYLLSEIKNSYLGLPARSQQKLLEVKENIKKGIEYYQSLANDLIKEQQDKFLASLQALKEEIEKISLASI